MMYSNYSSKLRRENLFCKLVGAGFEGGREAAGALFAGEEEAEGAAASELMASAFAAVRGVSTGLARKADGLRAVAKY